MAKSAALQINDVFSSRPRTPMGSELSAIHCESCSQPSGNYGPGSGDRLPCYLHTPILEIGLYDNGRAPGLGYLAPGFLPGIRSLATSQHFRSFRPRPHRTSRCPAPLRSQQAFCFVITVVFHQIQKIFWTPPLRNWNPKMVPALILIG